MDIRWKNRILVMVWILLLTFGVSGALTGLDKGRSYFERDYFKTQQFEDQLNQFINYLSMFELNGVTKEDRKKEIIVTPEEIDEHRYRYGDLSAQIENIRGQYEGKIQDAQLAQNKERVDVFIKERDEKIADITKNFEDDEHVRAKIVAEKEAQIDTYYKELEKYRPEFVKLKKEFKYYLKDIESGKVYTNVDTSTAAKADQGMNSKEMLFLRSYPTAKYGYLSSSQSSYYYMEEEGIQKEKVFEGKIGVPKTAPTVGGVLSSYYDYEQRQGLIYLYLGSAIIALISSVYLYKKLSISTIMDMEEWRTYYYRIPIDVALGAFGIMSITTLEKLSSYNGFHLYEYWYTFITGMLYYLVVTAVWVMLTLLQGKLLWERIKDVSERQEEWRKSLLYKVWQGVKEAFLIRSMGVQLILLLSVAFGFGGFAAAVLLRPRFILIFAPLFAVVGIPILVMMLKQTGYFNRIVANTTEIVRGNLEPDVPVRGKSALAVLANNINVLKHGVKTSQKEQAKSERLKTELITNVSHDLRTPLTSIISYTELLKTPDLTEEERAAYVQIIDRKSKRLKVLIDDLFEASKMASGSIELEKKKVDLVQLLQQAMAEHNDTIRASFLQFRVISPEEPVYAFVDGQKLWRVFDNLIGNILKYSLENTRVYIAIEEVQGKGIITFKNIAKYELGQDVDELFERFKRGDASRHTEGSGLGLAIAKSIVDLHGGSLDIEIDGDLFKITIELNTLR